MASQDEIAPYMAESKSKSTELAAIRELAKLVLYTTRPDMRVAWAAAGAAGLAYWFTREEASVAWFAILVGCVTALVLGFWWVAETGILLLSPTARFKSTLACVEELAGKFERRAEDGDRRRFLNLDYS